MRGKAEDYRLQLYAKTVSLSRSQSQSLSLSLKEGNCSHHLKYLGSIV